MTWFTAHIVMSFQFIDGPQDVYSVWENIVLIKADTKKIAFAKAQKIGFENEEFSGDTTLNDRPVHIVFSGIRKLVTFEDPDSEPVDGLEISYSEFEMKDQKSFEKFIKGKPVFVKYVD